MPSTAPPRTRGSTRDCVPQRAQRLGSPAHAGIDRLMAISASSSSGLPRARGDRPSETPRLRSSSTAPPRTRGSTRRRRFRLQCFKGSPAHAGIDPGNLGPPPLTQRLPRARGDRPRDEDFWRTGVRLPRARGDRPSSSKNRDAGSWAPPRTRGSTRARPVLPRRGEGSPAHAGIDPREGSGNRSRLRLPRARGDRP